MKSAILTFSTRLRDTQVLSKDASRGRPGIALDLRQARSVQVTKQVIDAKKIVRDIRSGMNDAELMRRYGLSAKGLESAFNKLINSRIMTIEEIYGHPSRTGQDTVIIVDDLRELPRHYLSVVVTVYDPHRPDKAGELRDITEKGIGIRGIQARIGETKTLVIDCRNFLDVAAIWFDAECVWIEPSKKPEDWQGGFQIKKITPQDLTHLRKLIGLFALK